MSGETGRGASNPPEESPPGLEDVLATDITIAPISLVRKIVEGST